MKTLETKLSNYLVNELSECCLAPIRYLDCDECKIKGIQCIWICTMCGTEVLENSCEIIDSKFYAAEEI